MGTLGGFPNPPATGSGLRSCPSPTRDLPRARVRELTPPRNRAHARAMRYWRLALVGAALCVGFGVGASSCGGGNSAADQFCQQWATDFCAELYACTPTDMRGSDFLGGSSQAQCVSGWSQSCSTPPPAGSVTLVNCSGGTHVNTAAEAACHQELTTITCDEFNSPTYVSVCDQVCGGSQS